MIDNRDHHDHMRIPIEEAGRQLIGGSDSTLAIRDLAKYDGFDGAS